jgi:hypothetical protein
MIVDAERPPGGPFFPDSAGTLNLEPIRQAQGKLFQDLWSRRHRIVDARIQKFYIDEKFTASNGQKKYAEWDKLMRSLFVRRK